MFLRVEGQNYPDLSVNTITQMQLSILFYMYLTYLLNCLSPLLSQFKLFTVGFQL